jgi:MFS family permease
VLGGVFGLASIVGPTLGGYLTDNLSWRAVFYVNVPVGILAFTFVYLTMPRPHLSASWRSVDFAGAITLAAGLVPALVAFSLTSDHAWTSPEVVGLLLVATAMLALFVVIERGRADAIIPLDLFRGRTFVVSVAMSFLAGVGLFTPVVFVPLLYQGVLGVSATDSGALLTPLILGVVIASVVTGQLITRVRRYRLVGTAGAALVALGLGLLAGTDPTTPSDEVVRDLVIIGLGLGSTIPLYLSAAQNAVAPSLTGVATSQVTFWRSVGATVGIAILGSVLSARLPIELQSRIAALGLPSQAVGGVNSGASGAQALFDPANLARLPVPVVDAIRGALAASLHDAFALAALAISLSVVVTLLLREVPIGAHETVPVEREELPLAA